MRQKTSNMHSFENEGLTSEPLGSEHDEQQVRVPTYHSLLLMMGFEQTCSAPTNPMWPQ